MPDIPEGKLCFKFSEDWQVVKYDEWRFYRNHFLKVQEGIKAVDILAIHDKTLWLIEIKDYRLSERRKTIELADEVALKVLYTLAGLLPAKINANEQAEQAFAQQALAIKKIRVVLHLEQVVKPSKLMPRGLDSANIQKKLREKMKAIDAHPLVVNVNKMQKVSWEVQSIVEKD